MFQLVFSLLIGVSHALVNGAPIGFEPDVVRIRTPSGHVCSGIFVDAYTVLTAAHCVDEGDDPEKVVLEVDKPLHVRVRRLIAHSDYTGGFFPHADVGILKTDRYAEFSGRRRVSFEPLALTGAARFFGTGRKKAGGFEYFRTSGTNSYLRLGEYLYFIGKTVGDSSGERVSIAHSDSGGTIVDAQTGAIIAVITQTTINQSAKLGLPTLSLGTSISEPTNRKFIQESLGP